MVFPVYVRKEHHPFGARLRAFVRQVPTAERLQLRTVAASSFPPSSDRERRHEPLDPALADGPQVVFLYV
jgi:hypothetical protein